MKLALAILATFSMSSAVVAEQCVERTEVIEAKVITSGTCTAVIEEAIRADVDGYLTTAYVVTLKGQRVVVEDLLNETKYATGETVSFGFLKVDRSPDTPRHLPPALLIYVIDPKRLPMPNPLPDPDASPAARHP